MIQCSECGALSADFEFCDRCGRGFQAASSASSIPISGDAVAPEGWVRLSDRLSGSPLAWADALSTVEKIARAVAEIHATRKVHGRLDPGAILLDSASDVKLLYGEAAVDTGAEPGARVTVRGYSAPEVYGRASGRLSFATDLFALGAILWRLVTAREPYSDFDDIALEYPTPRVLAPNLPCELDPLCRASLELVGGNRLRTIDEFIGLLRRVRGRIYARDHFDGTTRVLAGIAIDIGVAKGDKYPINQDIVVCEGDEASGFAAAIDGITNASVGTGERAAMLVRDAFLAASRQQLFDGFHVANAAIVACASEIAPTFDGELSEVMGAAAVAARWNEGAISVAWVGDARAYLFRDGELTQLTIDHDVATDALRRGLSPTASLLLSGGAALSRSIGRAVRAGDGKLVAAPIDVEVTTVRMLPGDTFLITSDGIPDWIAVGERASRAALCGILSRGGDPESVARALVDAANMGGGGDNLSCAVLAVS